MRKLIATLFAASLVVGLLSNASAKPATAFTDPVGDAGVASQGQAVPGIEQGGFDLVAGAVEAKGANLEFTVTHAAMPANGALPEGFRLMWHFRVGTKEYRFTAKSADIGKPDPLSGPNGTDRIGQVDLDGVFRLENWTDGQTVGTLTMPVYTVLANLDGKFDPAAKTITIILPMKTVKAKPGTVIAGGTGAAAATSCQVCWVPHYAERSLTPHTVIDYAQVTGTYKIPR